MKLYYPAIFIPYEDGFTVEFPDLPGCVTQGESLEEAFEMAEDAACGWILTSIEDDEDVPKPSPMDRLEAVEGFLNYVTLDIDEYAKKYSTKSVKKTLTIPEWLNYLAEKEGINFSKELQSALKRKLGLEAELSFEEKSTMLVDSKALESLISVVLRNFEQKNNESTMTSTVGKSVLPYQMSAFVN